jgi:hypothetical protein
MSPQPLVLSTTYGTRVALENPCKKRQGIVIGQLKDSCHISVGFRVDRAEVRRTVLPIATAGGVELFKGAVGNHINLCDL